VVPAWSSLVLASGSTEQLLEIAAEVRDAVARDLGAAFRLGEHEGALQHGLCVKREALGGPCRIVGRVERLRGFDVVGDRGSVRADIGVAGAADRGVRVLGLLHHRA
jgi:hypothetical protein